MGQIEGIRLFDLVCQFEVHAKILLASIAKLVMIVGA